MEEETVTFSKPPEGYEYRLMKKRPRQTVSLCETDPSELTSKQKASLKYREKNKEKLSEYSREYREKNNKKKEKVLSFRDTI